MMYFNNVKIENNFMKRDEVINLSQNMVVFMFLKVDVL